MKICYHCMSQIEEDHATHCPFCGEALAGAQPEKRYLRPGTDLGDKFTVGFPLGSGGFGNTYIGWNRFLLRKVAIKEFYPEQYVERSEDLKSIRVTDEKMQERFSTGLRQFMIEAQKVASLQDIPGVVEIFNFFEENNTGYIVMEYLEGMDIKTILEQTGDKKDYAWCRRVVLTLLDTLKQVHARGVIHRDISPDNLIVTNEGFIKLIDFGAAKHSAMEDASSEIFLKMGYAPIEQYSRKYAQGTYTDMYEVAALFYRMLTGQKPVPAHKRSAADQMVTPSQLGAELPEKAEMAIMCALNYLPQHRIQSAEDFMEALDGSDFVPVYEPEWILPRAKEVGKTPVWIRVLICVLILIVIAAIIMAGVFVAKKNKAKKQLNVSVEIAGEDSQQ